MIVVRKSLLTIFAQNLERSVGFYGTALGFPETYRFPHDGMPLHVEFDAGGCTVAVSSDLGLASHGMPPSSPGHSFELGLKVDNVDAAIAELSAAGVTVLREPFDSNARNRVAYISDPDGNWISLYHNLDEPSVQPSTVRSSAS